MVPGEDSGFWWRLVHLEPALWRGLIISVAVLIGTFGLVVTDNVQTGIYGVILAVVALVQALWTRSSVTANKKVVVYAPDPTGMPGVVEPGEATTEATPGDILDAAAATTSK